MPKNVNSKASKTEAERGVKIDRGQRIKKE
jgi:hypothetical protein